MWIFLSHKLSTSTPSYDDGPRLETTPVKQIARGDSSNTYFIKMLNHLGTHVDAPNHFDREGRPIASYTAEELVFEKPLFIEITKSVGEVIKAEDIQSHEAEIADSDLLLIRTGIQRFRESNPEAFMKRGVCLSVEAAEFLRKFKRLRALGVDAISISSPLMREVGREAHRRLLMGRSFLIIEDMDLLGKPTRLKKVIVAPLMVEGVDSSPCTVLAEV
ncbi:MAG: cyclase family protein [Candidatus Caldarchaeum sp.]|uniref:Cyclase family protein n=1 Tax=Caldiarchaeum subterraneum TaxID=311458 RepID=A0A7C5U7M7_CALS0